ncbi:MAG: PA2779 family protein [Thiogranum sp.]
MISTLMKRVMVLLVSVSFFTTYSLPAWSGMVTTDQMLQEQFEVADRQALLAMLDRDDVRRQLVERGVAPDYAKQRIAALSDAQVEELKGNIDDLPAGSGVVGIMIAVLLVLVILDIVGVTDIFTFINPPK